MEFAERIRQLGARAEEMMPQLKTEEATKNALIMPFITALGYDVFNPFEVNPEFIADIGTKKGEKVDYAIMRDGKPILLVECKHHLERDLNPHNSQLFRYFTACTDVRFAIITNGRQYRFYTDLKNANRMDERPFFEFDIADIRDNEITELKKFRKENFDIDAILNTASELQMTNEIKNALAKEIATPSEAFVRMLLGGGVYEGRVTQQVITQMTPLVRKASNELVYEMVTDRLKSALSGQKPPAMIEEPQPAQAQEIPESSGIDTTIEELEAFYIIKSILRSQVDSKRIHHRDTKSYFGILLDDNNRKPICRLHFNTAKKYIELFDESRTGTRVEINGLDDIYKHADTLSKTLDLYV